MSGEAWAVERARAEGFQSGRDSIEFAKVELEQARAEGREAGLEEAAQVLMARVGELTTLQEIAPKVGDAVARYELAQAVDKIRALKDSKP